MSGGQDPGRFGPADHLPSDCPQCPAADRFVAVLDIARMMIFEATSASIGIGVQPPTPTFGNIIADGQNTSSTPGGSATMPRCLPVRRLLGIKPHSTSVEQARKSARRDYLMVETLLSLRGLSIELVRGSDRARSSTAST